MAHAMGVFFLRKKERAIPLEAGRFSRGYFRIKKKIWRGNKWRLGRVCISMIDTKIGTPHNPLTGEGYSAKNTAILASAGFADCRWAGFRQWLELGRVVAAGQKAGARIPRVIARKDDGNVKKARGGVKMLAMFNFEQTVELNKSQAEKKAAAA